MSQLAVCAIIFILFYERDRQGEVFKVMTNASFFSAFSRLGSFSQVFGKVKEWLILELLSENEAALVNFCCYKYIIVPMLLRQFRSED